MTKNPRSFLAFLGSIVLFFALTVQASVQTSPGILILRRSSHVCPGIYARFTRIKIDRDKNGVATLVAFRLDSSSSKSFTESPTIVVTPENFTEDYHTKAQKFAHFAGAMQSVIEGKSVDLEYLEKGLPPLKDPSDQQSASYELDPYDPKGGGIKCEKMDWDVSRISDRFSFFLKLLDVNITFFQNVPTPDLKSRDTLWKTMVEYTQSILPVNKGVDDYAKEVGVGFGPDPIRCSKDLLQNFIQSSKDKYADFAHLNHFDVENGISIVEDQIEILEIRFRLGGRVTQISAHDLNAGFLKRNAFLGAIRAALYGDQQSPERKRVGATFIYAANPKGNHQKYDKNFYYGPYMCRLQRVKDAQDEILKDFNIWPRFVMVRNFEVIEGALDFDEL